MRSSNSGPTPEPRRAEGLPDSIIDALQARTSVPYEDDLQRLVHTAAKDLVETGRLRANLAEELGDKLGRPAVVELVALVGFYCMVSFTLKRTGKVGMVAPVALTFALVSG